MAAERDGVDAQPCLSFRHDRIAVRRLAMGRYAIAQDGDGRTLNAHEILPFAEQYPAGDIDADAGKALHDRSNSISGAAMRMPSHPISMRFGPTSNVRRGPLRSIESFTPAARCSKI